MKNVLYYSKNCSKCSTPKFDYTGIICYNRNIERSGKMELISKLLQERVEQSTPQRMGQRIKELRQKKRLSQTEVTALLGFSSQSVISKVENGQMGLPMERMIDLCQILNTTPEYMFFGIGEKFQKPNGPDLSFMNEDTLNFVKNPANYKSIQNLIIDLQIKKLQEMKK